MGLTGYGSLHDFRANTGKLRAASPPISEPTSSLRWVALSSEVTLSRKNWRVKKNDRLESGGSVLENHHSNNHFHLVLAESRKVGLISDALADIYSRQPIVPDKQQGAVLSSQLHPLRSIKFARSVETVCPSWT